MTKEKIFQTAQKKLAQWYKTPLGKKLFASEKTENSELLAKLFGYHAAQIGTPVMPCFLENSRIPHKINLLLTADQVSKNNVALRCSPYQLPIAKNSMDLVILPHLLEYSMYPYQALQEAGRILAAGGHAAIIVFNPWGVWGLWRILMQYNGMAPGYGKFIRLTTIRQWLLLLDLEFIRLQPVFFRPPIQHPAAQKNPLFMERLGGYCWPAYAAVYIVLAKKRIVPLTPMRLHWRKQPHVITPGAVGSIPRKKI